MLYDYILSLKQDMLLKTGFFLCWICYMNVFFVEQIPFGPVYTLNHMVYHK